MKLDRLRLTREEKQQILFQLLDDPDILPEQTKPAQLVTMSETVPEAVKRLQIGAEVIGVSSGYRSIDNLTKGFGPGELVIVTGHTSHGKSQLLQNMALRIAKGGTPLLIVSLEMTKAETTGRLIKISNVVPDEVDQSELMGYPIFYPKSNDIKASDMDSIVGTAVTEGAKIAMIDHLHYFSRSVENATAEIGRLVNQFKRVAVKHDVPVLLVSHIVKLAQKNTPGLEHLRDSSFIGQDADIVLTVWRDEDTPNEVVIKILKNRNRGFDPAKSTAKLIVTDHVKLDERLVW